MRVWVNNNKFYIQIMTRNDKQCRYFYVVRKCWMGNKILNRLERKLTRTYGTLHFFFKIFSSTYLRHLLVHSCEILFCFNHDDIIINFSEINFVLTLSNFLIKNQKSIWYHSSTWIKFFFRVWLTWYSDEEFAMDTHTHTQLE